MKMADNDSIWFQNDKEREISRWSISPDGDVEPGPGESIETDDNGTWLVKDELLWPEWYDRGRLQSEYNDIQSTDGISTGVYYRMYECKVVGDEEQIFRPAFFTYTWVGSLLFDVMGNPYLRILGLHGRKLDNPELVPVAITTGIDPAYSTSARADRTAIVNIATGPNDRIFELEGMYEKVAPKMLLHSIEANNDEFEPRRSMMDANGPQKYVYETVRDETIADANVRDRVRERVRAWRTEPGAPTLSRRAPGPPASTAPR